MSALLAVAAASAGLGRWPRPWRLFGLGLALACAGCGPTGKPAVDAAERTKPAAKAAPHRPVLSVRLTRLVSTEWQASLTANGLIAPAQEISISSELAGARIVRLHAEPGQAVRPGQLLAELSAASAQMELAEAEALVQEAEVHAQEARESARRSSALQPSGAISGQQVRDYRNKELIAEARLKAALSRLALERNKSNAQRVLAPVAGTILSKPAIVGSLVAPDKELYRLSAQGRMAWRAEVSAAELSLLHPGQTVTVLDSTGREVHGTVRAISQEAGSRGPVLHVDLPEQTPWQLGGFMQGVVHLGPRTSMTLPASAVLARADGSEVAVVDGEGRVSLRKVGTGQRFAQRLEIVSGISTNDSVVLEGAAFLQDGDRVQVLPSGVTPLDSGPKP